MLKQLGPVLAAGILLELLWIGTYRVGPFRENTPPFLCLMLAAFVVCVWSYFRIPILGPAQEGTVLAFALLFRLTALPAAPYQSEDVYRYIWDARVAAGGADPYRYPPSAPELAPFRDAVVYPQLNSKAYITVYPPLSQILFRLALIAFGESVTAMKAVFSLLEFAALLVAWRLLVGFGMRLEPLFLMAWNPFFVLEFSHSGHSDSAMMFCALLSVYLLRRCHKGLAMVSYAGAVLVKLHPALWGPLFIRRAGWKGSLAGMVSAVALLLVFFAPSSWLQYVNSLRLYYKLFEFNAGIHYLLRLIGRWAYDESWDQLTGPYLGATLILACLLIWWKFPARNERDLLHAAFWIMTADLCLATTVHPWYLSWAAFALPFFPYAFMIYWTGASVLSYLAYAYRPVYEPPWVLLLQYLPMYGLMIWEIARGSPLLPDLLERTRALSAPSRLRSANRKLQAQKQRQVTALQGDDPHF